MTEPDADILGPLVKALKAVKEGAKDKSFAFGVIDAVYSNGCTVIFDGETASSPKQYTSIKTFSPAAEQRVMLAKVQGSWVILGPIGSAGGSGGSAAISAWPVGSIYMSVSPANPATALGGGTWQAWGQGRVPISVDTSQAEFNTVEETGGEKTHTLSVSEMPSHTHGQYSHMHGNTFSISYAGTHNHPFGYINYRISALSSGGTNMAIANSTSSSLSGGPIKDDGYHSHDLNGSVSDNTAINQNAGGGAAHNNLPPYITCYMWKRTA